MLAVCAGAVSGVEESPNQPPPLSEEMKKAAAEPELDLSTPLYEQAPFDLLYLNPANKNAVLKLSPVNLPERKVPQPLPKSGFLEIELFDRPGERYRVPWQAIVRLKLFEEILLEQTVKLIEARQFTQAIDYLDYIETHYPNVAGLAEVRQLLLLAEAKDALERKQWERAVANLYRLAEINRQHAEVAELLGRAINALIEQKIASEQYAAARGLVESLGETFPQHPVVQSWQKTWQEEAANLVAEIERELAAGSPRQADRLVRKLSQIWPKQPGLAELVRRVQQAYPRIRVGVTQPAGNCDATSLVDWAGRRSGPLVRRPLVELTGPGPEGASFRSAYFDWEFDNQSLTITLRLRPDRPRFEDGRAYTAFDLAQQLLSRANRSQADYLPAWAELVQQVRMIGPEAVVVQLRRPQLKWEGLLRVIPSPSLLLVDGQVDRRGIGPYVLSRADSKDTAWVFLRVSEQVSRNDPRQQTGGPAEIEEIVFSRVRDAMRALRQGEIDVIDRLNPWEIPLLGESSTIQVKPYRLPLIHLLVPNYRKPLPSHRDFRRALLYALDRERILRSLLGGLKPGGCQVVSGPLLAPTSVGDPVGYGYDPQIKPRGFRPSLALALTEIAYRQAMEIARKRHLPPPKSGELVLVHPADEIAREACRQIQQQWKQIGWQVKLLEVASLADVPEEYDFMYVEAAVWEPAIDARLLFESLMTRSEFFSPQVEHSLLTFGTAIDWPDMGQRLREFHRWVYDDSTVLPLWQLVDFYAYRSEVRGLEDARVTLYQNVEAWALQ